MTSNTENATATATTTTTIVDQYDITEVNLQLSPLYPLFLHPNDNSGLSIISLILNGSNYSEWKSAMNIALLTKMKLGFITGEYKKPNPGSKYLIHWNRCNDKLIAWIFNVVTPEIRSSIVYITNANDVWDDLQDRFTQGNAPQIYQIRKEIISFTQGSLTISQYFTKLKALWDELMNLSNTPKCVCNYACGAAKSLEEYEHLQHLLSFFWA